MKKLQFLLFLSLFVIGRNQAQSSKVTFNIHIESEKTE